jgi:hypothetical protein
MVIFPFDVWCDFLFEGALGMWITIILDLKSLNLRYSKKLLEPFGKCWKIGVAKKMTNQVKEIGVEPLSQSTLHPMVTHDPNLQPTH